MKKIILLVFLLSTLSVSAQQDLSQYTNHPWRNKRVCYIGDSITDPNNKASNNKYWTFLKNWLGIEPFVPAKSGRKWDDVPRQTDLLQKEWGDNVDAIFIFLGTNDFFSDVSLGEWYSYNEEEVMRAHGKPKKMEKRKHRTLNLDKSTMRGNINIALNRLKKEFPTKQIVLLTPIHRAGFFPNDTNWQPTENYANTLGLFVDDYVQAVKEAANVWAVPVIDLNSLSGLYPLCDEHGELFFRSADTDRLHPNDAGHERMAKAIAAALYGIGI